MATTTATGPPGILIGHGPAFAKGRVEGVTIYDVFPLIAYLKALPVADDLPGAVPLAALDPALIAQRPVSARRATEWSCSARRTAAPRARTPRCSSGSARWGI